ncbi:G-protein coupled receptor 35 [Labrus mixtus]|uniref:G-protein coupled receptor 35 n=1 Tax=Labrus mixtus TaxID=508554 RepID=UPI0029C0AE6F|nr:G-protein coupled receptor 35 [Labrus mixtus]
MFTNPPCKVETLQGLAYCPLFLLGLLVNAAALLSLVAQRASWTDTHIYMLNLAAADSALILFLPFRIYNAFFCLPKTFFCTFLVNIHFINMYASIFTSAAISVHRYLTVQFPLQARSWRRKKEAALVVCFSIWVFVVTICIVFREENYPPKLRTCYERCTDQHLKPQFFVMLVFAGFLAPLLIIVFCSSWIIFILLKQNTKSEERKSTISIVTANMIVFIVCYTPIHVSFVVSYFSITPPNCLNQTIMPQTIFLHSSEWIASTNCCFDSISYYFLLKKFYL